MNARFRDPARQADYDYARTHHVECMSHGGGLGLAYRAGYHAPERPWPREWVRYPTWAAGRDRRRAEESAQRVERPV